VGPTTTVVANAQSLSVDEPPCDGEDLGDDAIGDRGRGIVKAALVVMSKFFD
jgi:hypothetical protein